MESAPTRDRPGRDAPDPSLFRRLLERVNDAGRDGVRLSAHLMTLYALARTASGPVVECGVGAGFSTLALLAGAAEANGSVTSYDVRAGTRDAALGTIGLAAGDARLRHWTFCEKGSREGAEDWPDGVLGLLFLDTTHAYADTQEELRAWAPRLQPTGIICGHDYLLHLDPRWTSTGVKRAVDEFVSAFEGTYQLVIHRRDHGLFMLLPRHGGHL
ncbi:MAG: class I SAM-dependent methyltransferase [Vicinamibacterales bacterium]